MLHFKSNVVNMSKEPKTPTLCCQSSSHGSMVEQDKIQILDNLSQIFPFLATLVAPHFREGVNNIQSVTLSAEF